MKEAQQLTELLQSLRADGPEGFEGLVARLLEKLTGHRFFLAHAGHQEGRDMSTGGFGDSWIAVEAKRFQHGTSFRRRDLFGALLELPDGVDLWVLTSTRRISDSLISALREKAFERGVAVEALDAPTKHLGDVPVLCAICDETVTSFLGESKGGLKVRRLLQAIRRHPGFEAARHALRERFQLGSIGYSQIQACGVAHLRSAFEDSDRSRAMLGQSITVLKEAGSRVVPRRGAWQALENWWNGWSATGKIFALLGEEGMGKSWALAAWLAQRFDAHPPTLPLTLFVPARAVESADASKLIAGEVAKCSDLLDARFWARRIEGFSKRPAEQRPAFLLVLDGLNEQPRFDWRRLLATLRSNPWADQVAVAITSRPAYWHDHLGAEPVSSVEAFELKPYDDFELSIALSKAGVGVSDLPNTLQPMLQLPRYLDLTLRHREALEESGEITVDRLLYEDWKDRASRRGALFSDRDFRSFLVQVAQKHCNALFSKREISDLLPLGDDFSAGLEEIINGGGILVRDSLGRYAVEPRRLVQAMGLLLADRVKCAFNNGGSAMRESIASFLEPQADIDRKVAVCRSAVTFSVLEAEYPAAARDLLFEQWVGSRNLTSEDFESFVAMLPASTASYLHLVGRFWDTRIHNRLAQRLLIAAFSRWRHNPRVQRDVIGICEKWLAYVHPYGYPFMSSRSDDVRAKLRADIETRAGRSLQAGDRFSLVDELEVTFDDEGVWRAAPALLLASLFPVAPFIPAFRRWALSRSIMTIAYEEEEVAWILRWSEEDLWPHLLSAVAPLLDARPVSQLAALHLLKASGREEAAELLATLPSDLVQAEPETDDVCKGWWRRDDCATCAARADLPDSVIAENLSLHAFDPDLHLAGDLRPLLRRALEAIRTERLSPVINKREFRRIVPALSAFAPHLLSDTYRALARDLSTCPTEERHFLLSEIGTIQPLIAKGRERRLLAAEWERVSASATWTEEESFEEVNLFAALLYRATAASQLGLLLRRREDAFDEPKLGRWFKRLSAPEVHHLAMGLPGSTSASFWRKAWYLCHQSVAPVVAVLGPTAIVDLLGTAADTRSREIANFWLFRSGCREAIDLAIERGMIDSSSALHPWFAARIRSRLPYSTLARVFDLGSLSFVVRRRLGDFGAYTKDLNRSFLDAVLHKRQPLVTTFCEATLQTIMLQSPHLVNEWVRLAVAQGEAWRSPLIGSFHTLLESLCEILLTTDPQRGVELFRALLAQRHHAKTIDEDTRVDVLLQCLFRVPANQHVERLQREWLRKCTSDLALLEFAVAALSVGNDTRLATLIKCGLASSAPVHRAVAVRLAGFAVSGSGSANLLAAAEFHPSGWLHDVRSWAARHVHRDRSAQAWLRRFATIPARDEAFAAFRLFLNCVDRRYWVWRNDVLGSTRRKADRRRYLAMQHESIVSAIADNEARLENHFLGRAIPEGKVEPWLETAPG